jgi:hypothetical protein
MIDHLIPIEVILISVESELTPHSANSSDRPKLFTNQLAIADSNDCPTNSAASELAHGKTT